MKRKLILLAAAFTALYASADMPVTLVNNSNGQFADSDIYIAIIGEQNGTGYIYYDLPNSSSAPAVKPLNESVNTLPGTGPFSTYADVFTKLSDIPGKQIMLGYTHACRMFIGFKSPMYLHAFAQGYAGADLNNPGDPNSKIRWELVEFTHGHDNGNEIWINTTRVDAFQYPMGLEVWGESYTPYTKRGETVDYRTVVDKWTSAYNNTVYKDCFYNLITTDNLGGIIKQPSKVSTIKDQNIFDSYVNKIWEYFKTNTANIDMGLLGRWTGTVQGDNFVLTHADDRYWPLGAVATIPGRPTTTDVIEGAGVFARGNNTDKTVQAMFCAAFNRGMFRATTDLQDWNPDGPVKAFSGGTEYPCNEYVKFFHDPSITASDGRTYAFAYDDTYDQSATCYCHLPTRATITIGGFASGEPIPAVPTAVITANPSGCKVGETVEFTAEVNGGDYEISDVVLKINGEALTTTPVSRGVQSVHKATWTAVAEGSYSVVAEMTAGDKSFTSAPVEFKVSPAGGEDPTPTPGPGDDEQVVVKEFTADDHSEGSFAGPYRIKFSPSGTGVLVTASFEGEYVGFAGPWLWNYTDGFAETMMEPDGNGSYEYQIPDVLPGHTVTVAVKIAFAGGMGVSPQVSYTVPLVNGIEETVKDEDAFMMYPNPADSEVNILASCPGELSVISMGGACVARCGVDSVTTLDVSALPTGIYLAVFTPADGSDLIVRKLIRK